MLRPLLLLPLLCAEDDVAEDEGPQASGALWGRDWCQPCQQRALHPGCVEWLPSLSCSRSLIYDMRMLCKRLTMCCQERWRGCDPCMPAAQTPSRPCRPKPLATVIVRTYTYESERVCDARMSVFLKSIEAAHSAEGQGFAGACLARYWLVGAGMVGPGLLAGLRWQRRSEQRGGPGLGGA